MFNEFTRALLQEYTTNPPQNETEWYGPWNSILAALFPHGYLIGPLPRIAKDSYHTRYLLFEVSKPTNRRGEYRTTLIVAVMHYPDWRAGVPLLETEIDRQADLAFSGGTGGTVGSTAISKLYWIGVIGPHWQYGVKDNGQELKPLIGSHDTAHDQASYTDFKHLADLVADI